MFKVSFLFFGMATYVYCRVEVASFCGGLVLYSFCCCPRGWMFWLKVFTGTSCGKGITSLGGVPAGISLDPLLFFFFPALCLPFFFVSFVFFFAPSFIFYRYLTGIAAVVGP